MAAAAHGAGGAAVPPAGALAGQAFAPMPGAEAGDPAAAMAAANAGRGAPGAGGPAGAEGGAGTTEALPPAGSIEYAIMKLAQMAKEGKYEEAKEIISTRAKGLAATIREGELTDSKIEALKTSFEGMELFSRKSVGNGVQFVVKNNRNQFLTFVVVKEGPEFVLREFTVREGK